jgi:hypothetical protein
VGNPPHPDSINSEALLFCASSHLLKLCETPQSNSSFTFTESIISCPNEQSVFPLPETTPSNVLNDDGGIGSSALTKSKLVSKDDEKLEKKFVGVFHTLNLLGLIGNGKH